MSAQSGVGNYFVANYPPFSFWRPECCDALRSALERRAAGDTPLGVYVHLPFCRKRCHFCYYRVYTDKDASDIRAYVQAVIDELRLYADRPLIRGRRAAFVYFGGGTPSYLSVEQLQRLVEGMRDLVAWDGAEEITFEAEPGTLTEHKLRAIRDLGVTRLSLGIENFDDAILETNGRAHRGREIDRAYAQARGLDFPQINIDLIAGMVGETDANWRACVRRTLDLAPDSVTIYQMEVPYNTTLYRQMRAEGRAEPPVADWETKRRWVGEAFEVLERAGYTVCSAYTAVRDPVRTRFVYRDRLWSGADLLALGVSAFGTLGGVHYQNQADLAPYLDSVGRGQLPVYRALAPTTRERLVRELVLQLKLGQVRRSYFRTKFGVELGDEFAAPLAKLRDLGLLALEGDLVRLSRPALLRADALLQEFFLPEHRAAPAAASRARE